VNIFAYIRNIMSRLLTNSQKLKLKIFAYRFLYKNDLSKLALAFETDKEGSHYYARHYQHHFHRLRDKKLNLLEIGIGGYDCPKSGGNSLRMWKAYFPKANIFGIDIYDKTSHDCGRIKTFKGSQIDESFLEKVMSEIGKCDIIIDDGSHINSHVIKTFEVLFPMLSPSGVYVIEDLQTAYWDEVAGVKWGGSCDLNAPHTSMQFLKRLVDGLNHEEFTNKSYIPTYFNKHIVSIHFYHNLAFIFKGENSEGSNVISKQFSP